MTSGFENSLNVYDFEVVVVFMYWGVDGGGLEDSNLSHRASCSPVDPDVGRKAYLAY